MNPMPAAAPVPAGAAQETMLQWLMNAGGLPGQAILFLGVVLTLWGILQLALMRSRAAAIVHLAMSLLPITISLVTAWQIIGSLAVIQKSAAVLSAASTQMVIADATQVTVRCVTGPLATIVPTILGLIQLVRLQSREPETDSP